MIANLSKVLNVRPMNIGDLKSQINIDKKRWLHIFTTNCYAYALGLDIPEKRIKTFAYAPGVIGNSPNDLVKLEYFTFNQLLGNIENDLRYMGIDFRRCDPQDEIDENEWKIAIFTAFSVYVGYNAYLYDFHFMRQDKKGIWLHKKGYFHKPSNLDSKKEIITDPRTCNLKNYNYQLTYRLKRQ